MCSQYLVTWILGGTSTAGGTCIVQLKVKEEWAETSFTFFRPLTTARTSHKTLSGPHSISMRISTATLRRTHLYGSVVRVQQELSQCHDLGGAVPAIWAVHQHWALVPVHSMHHQQCRLQKHGQVMQPFCAFKSWKPTIRTGMNEEMLILGFIASCPMPDRLKSNSPQSVSPNTVLPKWREMGYKASPKIDKLYMQQRRTLETGACTCFRVHHLRTARGNFPEKISI
jgi:hypothetical protein